MRLDQIADDILTLEGVYHYDHPDYEMRKQTVKDMIKHHSALYIRRDLDRNNRGGSFYRRIEVDVVPYTLGTNVKCLRTRDKIPEPVRLKGDSDFGYIGAMDGSQPFSEVFFHDIPDLSGHEISSGFGRYCRKNDYIYIVNTTNEAEQIAIDAVFLQVIDDTLEVADVRDFDVTYEFPVPRDMLQIVIKYVLEDLKGARTANEPR